LVAKPSPEQGDDRQKEHLRLTIKAPGLSAWQRFCPVDAWRLPVLQRMEAYLDRPATRALFDEHEQSEAYPEAVLSALRKLGLAEILSPRDGGNSTAYHMCALNGLAARRDTSVAVTLSVNCLGLLPAYLAGTPEQLETISRRVEAGNFAALLLTELPHGSNLLRNQARAERGTLDPAGNFIPVGDDDACTHYRLAGEKHLINGATQHGLMFVCLRTRNHEALDPLAEIKEPMRARGDFTMFWLDRGPGMTPVPRYHTLPARAADISGLRLENCVVGADHVIGREHGGLAVIHKTLVLSRGGVAALASGCLSGALDLAMTYAKRRNVYGGPIVGLGAIAEHLTRMQALDLLASAISLKATCLLNAVGLAASHYTSVAKLMACNLAEEGVREGQRVLGARALLRELPYERRIRDVNLYGIFDGTSHVMLEELSSRLAQEAKQVQTGADGSADEIRAIYQAPPRPVTEVLREFRRPVMFPMVGHLGALDALGGRLSLAPLAQAATTLFVLVRHLRETGQWKQDQGTRLAVAEVFAMLEVLIACSEICDPGRRAALGMPAPPGFDASRDGPLHDLAITWFGSRVVSRLRSLLLRSGLPEDQLQERLGSLNDAEHSLLRDQDETRRQCREALCATARPAGPSP
jgi:alkylation response protein AidB-like acyl-CoA dehydrogenase